tara:strand:- start:645 stop:1211 length:567 start_codon:yes stop_codon:yes gene_type:complete
MDFIENYNNKKNFRFESFKFALTEANKRNHKIIVETGVARGKEKFLFFTKTNWKDGMSTMIFSDYARYINGRLYSCDIEKKNVDNARKFTKKNNNYITFVVDDSLNFLKNFKNEIDFLYLDSLDGQFENASSHQLQEIKNSIDKLKKNSLVLLDDKGVKTKLSVKYMLENNFEIINETENQVLLTFNK